jgi:hypothetical protein
VFKQDLNESTNVNVVSNRYRVVVEQEKSFNIGDSTFLSESMNNSSMNRS